MKFVIASALVLALAGCSLGPAYRRPASPTVSTWRTRIESTGATWPSADWWKGFGSQELDQFIRQAQSANNNLAAAIAQVREADAEAEVAGAPLFPTISGAFTADREELYDLFSPQGGGITNRSFTAEIDASYEIDFWGENRALHRAALATVAANQFDEQTVRLTVMTGVANDYFSVLAYRDQLRIAHANLSAAEQTLRGLQIDERVGTTTSLDVAQQAAEVATLSAAIPPLRQSLQQSLDALAILVGRTPEHFNIQGDSLAGIQSPRPSAGMPSQLLERRPDVAQAEAELISANADVQAARAAFFPNVSLTGSAGYESASLSKLIEPSSRVFNLQGGITQPIFEGRALLGQYRYDKARYAELLADYRNAVISAFGNVEDSLAAVRYTTEQQQRDAIAEQKARRAYDLSQKQFRAGVIDILTVLSTETALFTAESASEQAKLARLQALVGLYNALGGGWSR